MRSRVLKFHNDNSTDTQKYKMTLNFSPPQVFPNGSEIGLVSLNIYNAVYNISDRDPSNNELFILCTDVTAAGLGAETSTDTRLEIFDNEVAGTDQRLYKIIITNGVYEAENLDFYVASLIGDVQNGKLKDYASRKCVISPDYSSGKFKIEFPNQYYDLVFRENYITSTNLAFLMGCDVSNAPIVNALNISEYQYPFQNSEYNANVEVNFWGLKKYKSVENIDDPLALQIAQINNGISSFNLRLSGNMIDGGITTYLDQSDIIYSFLYTRPPSYMERFTPSTIIKFPIIQTNTPIRSLSLELVDQNGHIVEDFYDSMFAELLITEP